VEHRPDARRADRQIVGVMNRARHQCTSDCKTRIELRGATATFP
jgi:hypothetical protein